MLNRFLTLAAGLTLTAGLVFTVSALLFAQAGEQQVHQKPPRRI